MELIEVNFNDEGDIIDTLSGKIPVSYTHLTLPTN